ncbi:MAG: C-GCAxxG-C-C family protein [Oscillospiraceae bacterium]|nr:C-GCAxxG-C-C family protein [Oscillospiraceae bacterium]
MDRAKIANDYHNAGYSCAQAVACAFSDVIGLPEKQIAAMTGAFGGGFRTGEICGVLSGGAVVLGAKWPHSEPHDMKAKSYVSKKVMKFQALFKERFPGVRCSEIRDIAAEPEKSPAAQRLGLKKSCAVYIVSAVEILEQMLEEE